MQLRYLNNHKIYLILTIQVPFENNYFFCDFIIYSKKKKNNYIFSKNRIDNYLKEEFSENLPEYVQPSQPF